MKQSKQVKTIKCSTGGIDCKQMFAGDLKPELISERILELFKSIPTFNFQTKIFSNLLRNEEDMNKFVVSYLKENRNDINALLRSDIKINNVLNSAFSEQLSKVDVSNNDMQNDNSIRRK